MATLTASQQTQSVIDRVKDGNLFTEWETSYDTSQNTAWYQIDLGSAQDIGSIEVYWLTPANARDVDLLVSENAADWEYFNRGHAYDAGTGSAFWEKFYGFAHARYVRFEFRNKTRSTSPHLGGIGELKIFAPGH